MTKRLCSESHSDGDNYTKVPARGFRRDMGMVSLESVDVGLAYRTNTAVF